MKMLIELPDGYKDLLPKIQNGSIACKVVLNAVKNGTVLPSSPLEPVEGYTDDMSLPMLPERE